MSSRIRSCFGLCCRGTDCWYCQDHTGEVIRQPWPWPYPWPRLLAVTPWSRWRNTRFSSYHRTCRRICSWCSSYRSLYGGLGSPSAFHYHDQGRPSRPSMSTLSLRCRSRSRFLSLWNNTGNTRRMLWTGLQLSLQPLAARIRWWHSRKTKCICSQGHGSARTTFQRTSTKRKVKYCSLGHSCQMTF